MSSGIIDPAGGLITQLNRDRIVVADSMRTEPKCSFGNSAAYESVDDRILLVPNTESSTGYITYDLKGINNFSLYFDFWAGDAVNSGGDGFTVRWFEDNYPSQNFAKCNAVYFNMYTDYVSYSFSGEKDTRSNTTSDLYKGVSQSNMDNSAWHSVEIHYINDTVDVVYDSSSLLSLFTPFNNNYTDKHQLYISGYCGWARLNIYLRNIKIVSV